MSGKGPNEEEWARSLVTHVHLSYRSVHFVPLSLSHSSSLTRPVPSRPLITRPPAVRKVMRRDGTERDG